MLNNTTDVYKTIRSKSYTLNLSNFIKSKRIYLNLYRQAMYQLYLMNYQSDPHCFNISEVRQALLEEGYDIVNRYGSVDTNPNNLLVAMSIEAYSDGKTLFNKGEGSYISVFDPRLWSSLLSGYRTPYGASAVYLVLNLQKQIESLDNFYESKKAQALRTNNGSKTFHYTGSRYTNTLSGASFTESVHTAITGKVYSLDSCNIYKDLWTSLREVYTDLPYRPTYEEAQDEWVQSPDYDASKPVPGRLVKNLSYIDEEVLLPFLLKGTYPLNTKEGTATQALMSGTNMGNLVKDFENRYISEFGSMLSSSLQHYTSEGTLTEDNLLYFDTETCIVGVDSELLPIVFNPLGYNILTGDSVERTGVLMGLCGELIPKGVITNPDGSEYQFKGVPLQSSGSNSEELYYDLEFAKLYGDVEDDVTTNFQDENLTINYGVDIDEELLDMYETSNLASAVLLAYNSAEAGYFGPTFYDANLDKYFEETITTFFN